jgi:hypothetical protein
MIALLLVFVGGFVCGASTLLIYGHWSRSNQPVQNPSDPGELVMAISAAIQAQLDRLAPVPAAIKSAIANAEADAAAAIQNHTDEVAALTASVDEIVAATQPA